MNAAHRGRVVVASLVMASTLAACVERPRVADGPLAVTDAWSRAADSGAIGVVYANLRNATDAPLTITTLSSADANLVDMHETMQMSGMVHMTARPTLAIPSDSTVALRAGGLHIMLSGLRHALRVGDSVTLALTLQDGRITTVRVPVREP